MTVVEKLENLLQLKTPLVAITFLHEMPSNMPPYHGSSPSSCAFWHKAQKESFYTIRQQHINCPIGMLTMGYSLSVDEKVAANQVMKTMCELQYLYENEADVLPRRREESPYIAFGPAKEMPIPIDLYIGLGTVQQLMLVMEAIEGMSCVGAPISLMGRPACAAIPTAIAEQKPVISLACIGARTYTQMDSTEGFFVVPASFIEEYVARMEVIIAANTALHDYHEHRLQTLS